MRNIIFCNDPLNAKSVDSSYELEFNNCLKLDYNVELLSFEEIILSNYSKSLKKISKFENLEIVIYRGWMLKETEYKTLYDELLNFNHKLINDPTQYLLCHYLPYNYELISEYTPKTIWMDVDEKNHYNISDIMEKLKVFNGQPIILKDYVKSQKHNWKEACFIEDSSNEENVKRITDKFIELQANNLTKGLVFREFIEFDFLNYHPKSKMPLTKEFRLFFFYNELIGVMNYWDEGEYENQIIEEIDLFKNIAKKITSNFFNMDVAKSKSGKWYIVELGDGQVTGFPDNFDSESLYKKIQSNK